MNHTKTFTEDETLISKEEQLLRDGQIRRMATFNAFLPFIAPLRKATGKGSKTKKQLYSSLMFGASTVFKTEEDEYQFIKKYGRGMWDIDRNSNVFNQEEMETIRLIAESFGAFDY
jgi:hypothetical protein